LVALFPSVSYAVFGLEKRIKELANPTEGFSSFEEELEYHKRSTVAVNDAKRRLDKVVKDSIGYKKYLPQCDLVLDSHSIWLNAYRLLTKMAGQ
jgi:hypothetical protein